MPEIEVGAIVQWSPDNIEDILSTDVALGIRDRLPMPGVMVLVDGEIGRMKYRLRNGRETHVTVRMSEIRAARAVV